MILMLCTYFDFYFSYTNIKNNKLKGKLNYNIGLNDLNLKFISGFAFRDTFRNRILSHVRNANFVNLLLSSWFTCVSTDVNNMESTV